MDYREHQPDPALRSAVKCYWTLAGSGDAEAWIAHEAVPDGCVEIIRRLSGRSLGDTEQPELFVAGVADRPATFRISGDSSFAAIRLWPWAWPELTEAPLASLWDRWAAIDDPVLARLGGLLPDFAEVDRWLAERLGGAHFPLGEAVLRSTTVAEIRARSKVAPRTLQRWFARNVGMAPSRYLRILRFHRAFESIPAEESLADQAASHGFADQAHMAREFRALAGTPAGEARRRARGPFLAEAQLGLRKR